MTPVALWTGRLPGLRPLPRKRTLWLVGGIVGLGVAGSSGLLGTNGPWLGIAASAVALWTVWRHRWPTELPLRQPALETPQGPDERAVMVEFRHEGDLIGWDVGILWFERGGVGFVGRTVSFVVPRAMMEPEDARTFHRAVFRAPHLSAKVQETTVGIVPLDRELNAQTTVARIEALPEAETSDTILPPSSMHPDLLQRGLTARRRMPVILTLAAASLALPYLPEIIGLPSMPPVFRAAKAVVIVTVICLSLGGAVPVPSSIRARLPKEPRKNRRPP